MSADERLIGDTVLLVTGAAAPSPRRIEISQSSFIWHLTTGDRDVISRLDTRFTRIIPTFNHKYKLLLNTVILDALDIKVEPKSCY